MTVLPPLNAFSPYELMAIFLKSLSDLNLTDQEIQTIEADVLQNVNKAIWAILLTNSDESTREKLSSLSPEQIKGYIPQLMQSMQEKPQVHEEIKQLVKSMLTDWIVETQNRKI